MDNTQQLLHHFLINFSQWRSSRGSKFSWTVTEGSSHSSILTPAHTYTPSNSVSLRSCFLTLAHTIKYQWRFYLWLWEWNSTRPLYLQVFGLASSYFHSEISEFWWVLFKNLNISIAYWGFSFNIKRHWKPFIFYYLYIFFLVLICLSLLCVYKAF